MLALVRGDDGDDAVEVNDYQPIIRAFGQEHLE